MWKKGTFNAVSFLLLFNIVFSELTNAINPQIKTNTINTGKDIINLLLLFIDMIVFLGK